MSEVAAGWIDPEVAAEFPELRLLAPDARARARAAARRSCASGCGELSDRFRGPQAVVLRQRPVPWAYRVFFRHIGLDPDVDRTPVEALALERLKAGGFRSRSLLDDALTIAVMETGVPVWALDGDRIEGELGLRPAGRGERFGTGEYASDIPVGRLLVADDAGPVGGAVRRARPRPRRRAGDDADDAVLGPGGRRAGHPRRGGAVDRRGHPHR